VEGTYERTGRPNFLEANNLTEFITKDLDDVLEMIEYRTPRVVLSAAIGRDRSLGMRGLSGGTRSWQSCTITTKNR